MQAVIEEHHDLLVSLRADVLSIKEQQKILSERIRNVFNHCKITVDMCRIGSPGNGPYWKDCATKFFPSEVEVSIVLFIVFACQNTTDTSHVYSRPESCS